MMRGDTTANLAFSRWRFVLVLVAFGILVGVVLIRLVMLHTFEQPFLYEQGEKRTVREEIELASRGDILDRNGNPLAISTPVYTLWLNPQVVNIQQLPDIARRLDLSPKTLVKRVSKAAAAGRSFFYLKRQVEPELAEVLMDKKIIGLYAEDDFRRYYPAAEVTAQTIGLIDVDQRGQEGLELAFDQYLKGDNGARQVVKDLYGNVVKQLAVHSIAQRGQDIKLTLDLRLQYIAYRELKAAVQSHRAKSGSAVLLDAKTGEILAMVSQPSYNPNNRSTLNPNDMRNRAVADVIEPGSTMKPFTVAAALESGKFTPTTVVDTAPGFVRIKGKTIRDHRNYGELDLTEIITKSSNVGSSFIATELGAEAIWQMFSKVGIGQSDSLGLPGEAIGTLPFPDQMDAIRLATASYGYGMSVTPLRLAEAYTAFTDGCRKPVSLIIDAGQQQSCEPVMSASNARHLRNMLETVTGPKGTGTRAKIPGYRVGGKTGTAHKVGRGGYQDSAYTAVFVGLAPLTDPDLILAVIVDEPQGKEYYGGEVAAPVFSRIMQQALNLRQVAPDLPIQNIAVLGGRS